MPKVSLFNDEQTEIILDMYGRGCPDREIAERVERAPRQVAGKIDYLRRLGLLPESSRASVQWTPENIEEFAVAWNDTDATIDELTTRFRRTVVALYRRASLLRDQGREMRHRGTVTNVQSNPQWLPRKPEFHTEKLFEDDPKAIGPGRLVYMPIRAPQYSSASSSLYGGRYISTSGKSGAVV